MKELVKLDLSMIYVVYLCDIWLILYSQCYHSYQVLIRLDFKEQN